MRATLTRRALSRNARSTKGGASESCHAAARSVREPTQGREGAAANAQGDIEYAAGGQGAHRGFIPARRSSSPRVVSNEPKP